MSYSRRLIAFLVLTFILMPLGAYLYFGAQTYPSHPTGDQKLVTNSVVLREALPEEVYSYVMTRIKRYHDSQPKGPESYVIQDDAIERRDGMYVIYLQPEDGAEPIEVDIEVKNYGNFFSISVVIDGKLQSIS